jgi:hypothetical protein
VGAEARATERAHRLDTGARGHLAEPERARIAREPSLVARLPPDAGSVPARGRVAGGRGRAAGDTARGELLGVEDLARVPALQAFAPVSFTLPGLRSLIGVTGRSFGP